MKFIAYIEGANEDEREIEIFNRYGKLELDPIYSWPTWICNFKDFYQIFRLAMELNSITFKVWLPEVNGEYPTVSFFLEEKQKKE